jgi:hypothetical protein
MNSYSLNSEPFFFHEEHEVCFEEDDESFSTSKNHVARVLCSVQRADWDVINWIERPSFETFQRELISLGENLLRPR